jgi:hypothetical protein
MDGNVIYCASTNRRKDKKAKPKQSHNILVEAQGEMIYSSYSFKPQK